MLFLRSLSLTICVMQRKRDEAKLAAACETIDDVRCSALSLSHTVLIVFCSYTQFAREATLAKQKEEQRLAAQKEKDEKKAKQQAEKKQVKDAKAGEKAKKNEEKKKIEEKKAVRAPRYCCVADCVLQTGA